MLDKIGEGLFVFSRHIVLFSAIVLVSALPVNLLTTLEIHIAATEFLGLFTPIIFIILTLFLPALSQAAVVWAIHEVYEEREPRFRDAFAHGIPRWFALFLANIIVSFFAMIGLLLCILPGVYVGARLALTVYAVVLEKKGPISSVRRSFELTSGPRGWSILAVIILISIFTTGPLFFFQFSSEMVDEPFDPSLMLAANCVFSVLASVINVILYLYYREATKPPVQIVLPPLENPLSIDQHDFDLPAGLRPEDLPGRGENEVR